MIRFPQWSYCHNRLKNIITWCCNMVGVLIHSFVFDDLNIFTFWCDILLYLMKESCHKYITKSAFFINFNRYKSIQLMSLVSVHYYLYQFCWLAIELRKIMETNLLDIHMFEQIMSLFGASKGRNEMKSEHIKEA